MNDLSHKMKKVTILSPDVKAPVTKVTPVAPGIAGSQFSSPPHNLKNKECIKMRSSEAAI